MKVEKTFKLLPRSTYIDHKIFTWYTFHFSLFFKNRFSSKTSVKIQPKLFEIPYFSKNIPRSILMNAVKTGTQLYKVFQL